MRHTSGSFSALNRGALDIEKYNPPRLYAKKQWSRLRTTWDANALRSGRTRLRDRTPADGPGIPIRAGRNFREEPSRPGLSTTTGPLLTRSAAAGTLLAHASRVEVPAGARPAMTLRPALAAPLLVLLSFGGSNVRGLSEADETWIRAETAHFTLLSCATEERTRALAQDLEWFRAVLLKVYEKVQQDFPRPSYIFVFKDRSSFAPYSIGKSSDPAIVTGWFSAKRNANYAAIEASSGREALHVIHHEYVHELLENNVPGLPAWFHEGLAECVGAFRLDGQVARIGEPDLTTLGWLRRHSLMPVGDLLTTGSRSVSYSAGERRWLLQAESWAFVHYLLWNKSGGKLLLIRLLDQVVRGRPPADAFSEVFGTTPEKFTTELRNYVNGRRFLSGAVAIGDLSAMTDVRITPMRREEVLCRLGDMRAHVALAPGKEVEAMFREALALNPSYASAHIGLGYLKERAAAYDEAQAEYDRAVQIAPDDYIANFSAGSCLVHRFQAGWRGSDASTAAVQTLVDRMRVLLGKSLSSKPDFAEAYAEFGATYLLDGAGSAAGIRVLEQARSMLPGRTDIVVNLVRLYLAMGQADKARALIDGVLVRSGDADALASARRALEGKEKP